MCQTEIRDLSRMCIILKGQDGVIEQARRQLEDLVSYMKHPQSEPTPRYPSGPFSTIPTPDVSNVNSYLPKSRPSALNSPRTIIQTAQPLKQPTTKQSTKLPPHPLLSLTTGLPLLPTRLWPKRKLLSHDHSNLRQTPSTPPGDRRMA